MRLAYSCALAALVGSACGQGEVEVVLRLPEAEAALPEAADQVTLRAERADGDPVILTAPVRDGAFDLGELPVDAYRRLTVTLTSAGGGLVGYGRAETPLEVSADGRVRYEIPVRRPRTYAAGPTPDAAIEAPVTLETARLLRVDRSSGAGSTEALTLPAGQAPRVVASAGAELFLGVGATVLRLDTSLDTVGSEPVATVGAPVVDLAGSADGRFLVVGAGTDMTIVDLGTGNTRPVDAGGAVGAVTIATEPDGTPVAVALVDAVKLPSQCAAVRSRVVITPLDTAEAGARTIELDAGVADIAGVGTRPFLAVAALCANRVLVAELGPDTVTPVTAAPAGLCTVAEGVVCAPAAVVATDDQAWAAGTVPSTRGSGLAAVVGARHQIAGLGFTDGVSLGQILTLPELAQPLNPTNRPNLVVDRNMKARDAVVSALSLSEDGTQLTLTSNGMAIAPGVVIPDPIFGDIDIVPFTVLHLSQQFAVSTRTGSIEASRRTRCAVCVSDSSSTPGFELGQNCGVTASDYSLPDWQCGPPADTAPLADFEGGASASLFGRP